MKDVKNFDMNRFVNDGSATVTTAVRGNVRPSKLSVSSEQSGLTERNDAAEQTVPTPSSRHIEKIMPTPFSAQTAKTRQTLSTSVTEQSVPSRQIVLAQTTEPPQPTPAPPSRVSSRQRRASLDEYRDAFLTIPKIADRQPVFVSRDVRDRIDGVVRRLGERKMSVSGFLENLARHHLDLYTDDLEQWRRL